MSFQKAPCMTLGSVIVSLLLMNIFSKERAGVNGDFGNGLPVFLINLMCAQEMIPGSF